MISSTTDPNTGRVLVVYPDTPQAYTVYVKEASDWDEIHNYIINENEIDNIPNRKIDCTSEMNCSSNRGVYEMSPDEAEVLRNHPKINLVERAGLYNEYELEQRKYDEKFDSHLFTSRFKYNVNNKRPAYGSINPGSILNFTQWGLYRHEHRANKYGSSANITQDLKYSLSGKNVDVVIMDTGVRWDHPEFLKPAYTSVPNNLACEEYTRVRDILIHGASDYGINWANEGLVAPGTGTLSNYNVTGALLMYENGNSSNSQANYHGCHCAGTAAGNQFGWAFESNIWNIACIDRSDLGWSDPCDAFDYIRVWHKNKPINPETGRRNPTVVNGSWGFRQFFPFANDYDAVERGVSFNKQAMTSTNCPSVYHMDTYYSWKEFTNEAPSSQAKVDELFNDPDCDDLIVIFAAGNSKDKQDNPGGIDYDNYISNASFVYTSDRTNYYNRAGTPAIAIDGRKDAPISVGAMDAVTYTTAGQERKASFSNSGPRIDVWAAGYNILSPYGSSGFQDPRNNNFFNANLNGTSMAAPQVCGVVALYLQSQPHANRVDVRNWIVTHGSTEVPNTDATSDTAGFYDPYQSNSATDEDYWGNIYSIKSAPRRILYNPFCNDGKASLDGVELKGVVISYK